MKRSFTTDKRANTSEESCTAKRAAAECHKKFKVVYDSSIGRHLVASETIYPGEVIIDEPAIIRGPCIDLKLDIEDIGEDAACCVCFRHIKAGLVKCSLCSYPLFCSQKCSSEPSHTSGECKILRVIGRDATELNLKQYCNLMSTIRCLLVRYKSTFHWIQICKLQSKVSELEEMGAFLEFDKIFDRLDWEAFKTQEGGEDTSDELDSNEMTLTIAARHCYGVMRMNAYSHLKRSCGFEGLYFLTALMSHSCVMNTDRNFDVEREGRMVVKAAVKIQPGETITTTYLSLLSNTPERHADMQKNWLFTCSCPRCKDPAELGSHLSTSFLNEASCDPINITSIKSSLPNHLNDIDSVETWLQRFDTGEYLHPNHSLFSQVKLYLALSYGREPGGIQALTNDKLIRKYELCSQIVGIFNVIYPGIYQCKGELLFELWNAAMEIDSRHLHTRLHKGQTTSSAIACMAHEILKHSTPNSSYDHMKQILENEYPKLLGSED